MQQAARVSDRTAFFNLAATGKPGPAGRDRATPRRSSATPSEKATEDYISGRFG
jgi:phosphate transport system ATP-binding protein